MKRRNFLTNLSIFSTAPLVSSAFQNSIEEVAERDEKDIFPESLDGDIDDYVVLKPPDRDDIRLYKERYDSFDEEIRQTYIYNVGTDETELLHITPRWNKKRIDCPSPLLTEDSYLVYERTKNNVWTLKYNHDGSSDFLEGWWKHYD